MYKNITRNAAILLLTFTATCLQAALATDGGSLTGRVFLGKELDTRAGINVQVLGTHFGAATLDDGSFIISGLPQGEYTLKVTAIGYATRQKAGVAVNPGLRTTVEIILPQQPLELDEIVVTGSMIRHRLRDTPVVTHVVSKQDIADTGASDLVSIMREQAGIEIANGIGQTQSAQVQGLSNNHVLILVDGERITGHVDGALDLGQIAVNQIERIETVRGPMSAVYGSDALGGVINIITKQPESTHRMSGLLGAGANGRQDYELSVGGIPLANGRVNWLLQSSWNKYFGVDYDPNDNFTELPEYDRKNLRLRTNFALSDRLTLDLQGSLLDDENTWLSGTPDVAFTDISSNRKQGVTAKAGYTFSPGTALRFVSNISRNEHELSEYGGNGTRVLNDLSTESYRNNRLQMTLLPYKSSILTLGAEHIVERITSDRIIGEEQSYRSWVVFAEDEWSFSRLTLTTGARYTNNSVYGGFFAPKINAMVQVRENLRVRFGYGRGYRQPSIKELFINFFSTVGYVVQGEPTLQPEKSQGLHAGVEFNVDSRFWLRSHFYNNRVSSLIDYYTAGAIGERILFSYYNLSKAVTRGAEIDLTWKPARKFEADLGYSYTMAEDTFGNALPFRVPHTLRWKLAYTAPYATRLVLRGRLYDQKRVLDDQVNKNIYSAGSNVQQSFVPGYALWDVQVSRRVGEKFRLALGVQNLGNQKFYPFGQIRGREFYSTLKIMIQ